MPNQITRDIYVTKDALKNPIHYVRGTDLIPIVMRFCDFTIPSGATARIFVGKPDGNSVYTSATIEGNTVTIDVTEQMFVTLGLALMQVSIMDGGKELVTFAQPVIVEPNLKAGDFPESSTDITFLDDAIEQANEAVETATTAAQKAATAVQNANAAISKANSAIEDVNEAVVSMNANFANLAQVTTINALQTTAKTVVGAINELNSKTNVFVTTKQGFWDLNSKLKKGICYPIFLNNTAVSEITNGRYNVSGKGIFSCGDASDIMLMLGNGDTILTGRIQADQDPSLFVVKPEEVV